MTEDKGFSANPLKSFKPYEPSEGESYMSAEQLEHFRKILENWKQELINEALRTIDHLKDEVTQHPDPVDRASQEEEFSIAMRARDRERKLIEKINQTLKLIRQGKYGYCEICGAEIGLQRLEARPTATQCINCKSLAELKERQLHG